MLNVMRENLRHLKWVLVVVAAAMVLSLGYFFSDNSAPGQGSWAARVNGTVITERQFLAEARQVDEQFGAIFGENSRPMVARTAMQRLIERELVIQDAHRLGIESSKEDLAREIRNFPFLADETGEFIGTERYMKLLERQPGGVTAFERSVANDIVIRRWTGVMTQAVSVNDAELEREYRRSTEKTSFDYVVVASADQDIDTSVTDEQARSWHDAHPQDYRRGRGRRIRFAFVEREAQLAAVQITDEEIAASYESNQDRYAHPAQRQARHILFRIDPGTDEAGKDELRARAEGVLERLEAGEDFAELARSESEDPGSAELGGDLGYFGPGDMVEPFENAVFAAGVGELTPVVETQFGFHVIEVTDAREAGKTPLPEVRDSIRQTLQLTRADERVTAEAQRLADQLDGVERFAELAAAAGLEVQSRLVSEDEQLYELGVGPDFLTAAFSLEPGQVSQPLRSATGLVLLAVDEEVPAQVSPFEEAEAKVRSDVLNRRAADAALAATEEALARGETLAELAEGFGVEVRSSGEVTPGQTLPGTGGSSVELEALVFGDEAEVGDRGVAAVPSGAVAFDITAREPFNSLAFEVAKPQLRTQTIEQRRNLAAQAVLQKLWETQEIERNAELLTRFAGTAGS